MCIECSKLMSEGTHDAVSSVSLGDPVNNAVKRRLGRGVMGPHDASSTLHKIQTPVHLGATQNLPAATLNYIG
jgi:hypothetical protein